MKYTFERALIVVVRKVLPEKQNVQDQKSMRKPPILTFSDFDRLCFCACLIRLRIEYLE